MPEPAKEFEIPKEFTRVESSNLLAVAYLNAPGEDVSKSHTVNDAELHVAFKNGNRWAYFDVPRGTFHALVTAPSAGKYFNANVKGKFKDQAKLSLTLKAVDPAGEKQP